MYDFSYNLQMINGPVFNSKNDDWLRFVEEAIICILGRDFPNDFLYNDGSGYTSGIDFSTDAQQFMSL